jgi:hypothetical protein
LPAAPGKRSNLSPIKMSQQAAETSRLADCAPQEKTSRHRSSISESNSPVTGISLVTSYDSGS